MARTFPPEFAFRHTWRPYQARILEELQQHLGDRSFHVVAAPGSGKTVLGLEVVRRIGRPTLVLTPTLAVREQWVARLAGLFWDGDREPDWVSRHLEEPAPFTVSTYQGLDAFIRKHSLGELLTRLQAARIEVLVFDEAHHLRNQWWQSLSRVRDGLADPFTIALTATPPYDATQLEWNRYCGICGEIDAEVPVPEMVRARTLCPHQDYIYFTQPAAGEREVLDRYAHEVRKLINDLSLDPAFVQAVREHPVLAEPDAHVDELLARTDYYLSLAIFLSHAHGVVPPELRRALRLEEVEMPPLTPAWAETMLTGALFFDRDAWSAQDRLLDELVQRLRRMGAVERRRVYLRSTLRNTRLLRASPGKLEAIAAITELENRLLGARLRLLVLTDYIREGDFPGDDGREKPFVKLGVVPIFEHLRRLRLPGIELAVLTGKLVVLPAGTECALREKAPLMGVDPDALRTEPLRHAPDFLRVRIAGDGRGLLPLMTRLFRDGDVNVLVGTAALLGEGWDAPAINTLVLATVIGSYVSSNQLRGRTIRVDPRDAMKAANIWHLCCLAPGDGEHEELFDELLPETLQDDWELLARRFRTFVAPERDGASIRNGLDRLGLEPALLSAGDVRALNRVMCSAAEDRDVLRAQWLKAIDRAPAGQGRIAQEIYFAPPRIQRHTIVDRLVFSRGDWLDWLRRWMLERRARAMAQAVMGALCDLGEIATPDQALDLDVSLGPRDIRARLGGATRREESLFVAALREVFDPLAGPRYLLVAGRDSWCVPSVCGNRKDRAEAFARHWTRRVGRARLVYTRSAAGKTRLLHAKQQHLAERKPHPQAHVTWR